MKGIHGLVTLKIPEIGQETDGRVHNRKKFRTTIESARCDGVHPRRDTISPYNPSSIFARVRLV